MLAHVGKTSLLPGSPSPPNPFEGVLFLPILVSVTKREVCTPNHDYDSWYRSPRNLICVYFGLLGFASIPSAGKHDCWL